MPDENNGTEKGLEAVRIVRDYFQSVGLEAKEEPFEHGAVFRLTFDGPAPEAAVQVHTDIERLAAVFMFPGHVAQDRRLKVAEFIVRANWGLIEGSFEMSFETGAFAYKSGIDFTYNGLTAPLLRNIMLSGMENIESYAAELLAVVEGQMEPGAAALAARSRLVAR